MPDRQSKIQPLRQPQELFGLSRVNREWLLHVDMAPVFQTLSRDLKVALRRRRDVNNVGPSFFEHPAEVIEGALRLESHRKLMRHKRFTITDSREITAPDPSDLRGVGVGDFPTSDDRHSKRHCALGRDSSRSIAGGLRTSARAASS
jgi:hypothetical protein